MEPFFDTTATRYPAAGLFLSVAVILGCFLGATVLRKRPVGWPVLVVGCLGVTLWLATALSLIFDGSIGAGLLLTALIFILVLASGLTLLISERSWLPAAVFGLLGCGALLLAGETWAFWVAGICAVLLAILIGVLLGSGYWWPIAAYGIAGVMVVAIGGATALATSAGAAFIWRSAPNIRCGEPYWLLLLLLIPLTVWWSFRSLAGLGPVRRWVALGLRSLLILFLCLALAEVYLLHRSDTVTVLFLWDRSLSIPEEFDPNDTREPKTDLVKQRHLDFINKTVAQRGPTHQRDSAGLIVFGRYPRLELPPSSVPRFGLTKLTTTVDETYTDISAAIKLALACFPEETGKRIVLISDGNENLGKAEDQARIAKQNGVEIDTVLVASSDRNQNEIMVERIEAPAVTEADRRLPIRIVIRSYNPNTVVGRLSLTKTSLQMKVDPADPTGQLKVAYDHFPVEEKLVRVRLGLNAFYLQQPGLREDESYTYEAKFIPIGVEKAPIDLENPNFARLDKDAVKLDRPENNYASTSVLARGEKKVLLIEAEPGDHALLVKTLRQSSLSLKVGAITPADLPQDPERLNFFLSGFDCVILANVPRDMFTTEQDAALRTAVHEQGSGLIMIGGRWGFGGGAWQNTEVEKALPVTCDLKSLKIEGRSGLVLIMHASEIAEGNAWQKKIAKLAIEKLSPIDMMGMLYYDWNGPNHKWHIPFQTVGESKRKMLALVDTMQPGDMPDAEPSLRKAHDALSDPQYGLGTKHIIFISDGDHWRPPVALLKKIKAAKITVTTVCITSHGQGEYKNMGYVAKITGGREYPQPDGDGNYTPLDPQQLPQIYMKETRLISQSFIYEKTFIPRLLLHGGPTEGLGRDEALPPLHGLVRATPRTGPLVQLSIMTPVLGDAAWPVLAHWQYGLGKGIAFTSDALTKPGGADDAKNLSWDRDWAKSEMYSKFWDQLVEWSLRELDKGKNLQMATEWRDGKVVIVLNARDDERRPLGDLDIVVRVTSPTSKAGDAAKPDIKLEQKNAGRYEAEVRAEDVGSYLLTAMAFRSKQVKGDDGKSQVVRQPFGLVRSALTVPYSPEFAEMESNPALLHRLSDITGGKVFEDNTGELARIAKEADVFRASPIRTKSLQSVWYWLLVLAGIGLFFDVAVRRIAVDPATVSLMVRNQWQRLRGAAPLLPQTAQFLERLKSRKEQVGEAIEKEKAGRRFEGPEAFVEAPPAADACSTAPAPPAPSAKPPTVAPDDATTPADYASRLLRAKRKALEDRDKENPPK
jgi:uncharacterized membrane protein